MSNARTVAAVSTSGKTVAAESVTALAAQLNTSRTNVSDALNRKGREGFHAQGEYWVAA